MYVYLWLIHFFVEQELTQQGKQLYFNKKKVKNQMGSLWIHVFQKRHTDGQEEHEKMLYITNQQGNENQKRYHLIPVRMTIIKDNKQQVFLRIWRKGKPHALLVEMYIGYGELSKTEN